MANQQSLSMGRKPTHRLYRVTGDGDAAIWTPIGAAWPNKDGKGFSIACDAVPLQGRMILRFIEARNQVDGVSHDPLPCPAYPRTQRRISARRTGAWRALGPDQRRS